MKVKYSINSKLLEFSLLFFITFLFVTKSYSQENITSPELEFGFQIGSDYSLVNYDQLVAYWKKLDQESPRIKVVDIGPTTEGNRQYMAIITSIENHKNLDYYHDISKKLALAKDLNDEEAKKLAEIGKAVVWIDGGLHSTEVVGAQQLIKLVYEMCSKSDKETMRILDDVIILAVLANPDGMNLVSNWYMRIPNPEERSTRNIPRLYQKYIGHDNNRDSYMNTQLETQNMSKIMYIDWFPQLMYNHHQSGPSDHIVFIPPFRDPPNYYYDPLISISVQAVGTAMHSRLIENNMGGSGMRSMASYSTWFNGNLRTTGYFHNQIGILTEIKGNPTPMKLAFFPRRQIPTMDMPMPHQPRLFYFKEAIDYSLQMDYAVLDYASRNRSKVLYNRYIMGRNHIDKGNKDHWTIHPKIADQVIDEVNQNTDQKNKNSRKGVSYDFLKGFKKPENRDARAYIIPSNQKDFPTATKFVNAFLRSGVEVLIADEDFTVNQVKYPKGSYIFKTNQAFRPHIMDLFEPQDYPNDFKYNGGPPIAPYDNAGYTLAFQMGIKFDRILNNFSGPFRKIDTIAKPIEGKLDNLEGAKAFLLDHAYNDASIVMNRLLASNHKIYWLKEKQTIGNHEFQEGAIYIKAKSKTHLLIKEFAKTLGLNFVGVRNNIEEDKLRIRPVRIGLWDRYGGSMSSGWTRWILEQYDFPFNVVYPKEFDEENLIKKYDVLIFVTGAIPSREVLSSEVNSNLDPNTIPDEYKDHLGRITTDKTLPRLLKFMNDGGSIITIGSSSSLGKYAQLPISDHMTDRNGKALSREEYFIPSSILQVKMNNKLPIAYGMNERVDVFFNKSPVYRLMPEADKKGVTPIAWFDSDKPLRSGWAWGQNRLYGGVCMLKAKYGKGNLYLFGPEILFRAQSHGTFKLFFNSIYLSKAKEE